MNWITLILSIAYIFLGSWGSPINGIVTKIQIIMFYSKQLLQFTSQVGTNIGLAYVY